MAVNNFAKCLPVILANEGGLSLNRKDPGNWSGGKVGHGTLEGTNFGIAAAAHPGVNIRGLTKESAGAIYEREYWTPAGCETLPAGLDLSHFDADVNSGGGRAAKLLAAAKGASIADRIHAYNEARLSFLHALKTWVTFGKAWNTRVAGVEAKSLRMALGTAPAATAALADKARQLGTKAATASTASTAGTLVTAGTATAAATTGHPWLDASISIASALAALYAGYVKWRDGARAAALAHAATDPTATA